MGFRFNLELCGKDATWIAIARWKFACKFTIKRVRIRNDAIFAIIDDNFIGTRFLYSIKLQAKFALRMGVGFGYQRFGTIGLDSIQRCSFTIEVFGFRSEKNSRFDGLCGHEFYGLVGGRNHARNIDHRLGNEVPCENYDDCQVKENGQ